MDFNNTELRHINWNEVEPITRTGESGTAVWKEKMFSGFRVAVAEISPGYRSAEPCSKGHVLYCIEGELTILFNDGREIKLAAGESLVHGEGEPHIAVTGDIPAKIFVVD